MNADPDSFARKLTKIDKNKLVFQPFKKAIIRQIQLFVSTKADQDPIPYPHGSPLVWPLGPDPH